MTRNLKKEAAWQKEKYRRFGFAVDRGKGEKFTEILTAINKTPLEWFKEQVDTVISNTVTVSKEKSENTVTVSHKPKTRKPSPTNETVAEWANLHKSGLSFAKIAAGPDGLGYDKTTISKRVAAYLGN